MKKNALIFCLLFLSIFTFAQTKIIMIFCEVGGWNGKLTYPSNLDKTLPDSIKSIVMINPRKDDNLKDPDDIVLFMGADGWRIASYDNRANLYILSREITMDEPAWELYTQKLKGVEAKQQK
jgi:hypothetical protein